MLGQFLTVHLSVRKLLPSAHVCAGDAANEKGIGGSILR